MPGTALTLYAGSTGTVASVTPAVDLAGMSTALSGATGAAPLSPPAGDTVMIPALSQQVLLVLQYHFGTA